MMIDDQSRPELFTNRSVLFDTCYTSSLVRLTLDSDDGTVAGSLKSARSFGPFNDQSTENWRSCGVGSPGCDSTRVFETCIELSLSGRAGIQLFMVGRADNSERGQTTSGTGFKKTFRHTHNYRKQSRRYFSMRTE